MSLLPDGDDRGMVIVIRCDVCQCTLEREAVALSFTKTARVVDKAGETRVIDSGAAEEYLLCGRCARYLDRCVSVRAASPDRSGEAARTLTQRSR